MGRDLRAEARLYAEKIKKIRLALFDVDGVCTSGHLYWSGEEVGFNRFFHAHDGYGMKQLMKNGIQVGIITGGDSLGVKKRFEGLGVDYLYMGNEDKRKAFAEILTKSGISSEECLYIGDEFFDLPILTKVGFSVTVPDASIEIKEACDYTTFKKGGEGAVREVIDMIRFIQEFKNL